MRDDESIEVILKWSYGTSDTANVRHRESETFTFPQKPTRNEVLKKLREFWQLQLECFVGPRRSIPRVDNVIKRKVGRLELTNFTAEEITKSEDSNE